MAGICRYDCRLVYCTTSALSSELHDQLVSLDRHAQLTRSFSVVADLLVLPSECFGFLLSIITSFCIDVIMQTPSEC